MNCSRYVSFDQKILVADVHLQEVVMGMYQLIIVSPELLLNDERFKMLWGKKQFMDNIVNFVLDEAHVIKEWGGMFRTDYLKIGPIQYLFPRMIGFHLGSVTIGPALVSELAKNLHLQTDDLSVMHLNTIGPTFTLLCIACNTLSTRMRTWHL